MTTKNAKQKQTNIADTFIRDVQVNYVSSKTPSFRITGPANAVSYLRTLFPDNSREHFIVIYLDGSNCVASYSVISTGTANSAQVHPREIFQRAVLVGAVSIIAAHNHPSGNLNPSLEDRNVSTRIQEAGELLGIRVLDSLIITNDSAYSIMTDDTL
ncbi:MAG TPA: JAB domain-containing protein [Pirellulaceae bacterium]|nr:JAB domain-containing protein [Pirellulaceae bacterium]HMO93573.1 JAB domain-containing protein [Pirellulaceae bacterium]HMP71586.1 JAB domain-containing protein [Pirellulaceae bacterium]